MVGARIRASTVSKEEAEETQEPLIPLRTGEMVNGKEWKRFSPDKEVIELEGFTGKAVVVASY